MEPRSPVLLLACTALFALMGAAYVRATPEPYAAGQRADGLPHMIHRADEARPAAQATGATPQPVPLEAPPAHPLSQALETQPAETQRYIETFETNWTEYWLLRDYSDADGGEYLWGKRKCTPHTGEYSAFSTGGGADGSGRGCTSQYPHNARSWAFFGPIDLSVYISGTITVYFRGSSEWNSNPQGMCDWNADDIVFIGAGPSMSPEDIRGYGFCGDWTSGYYERTFDLNELQVIGQSQVYLALFFYSDEDDVTGTGFTLDDLLLTLEESTAPTPTPTPLPTLTPTPGAGPSIKTNYLPLIRSALPICNDSADNDRPQTAQPFTTIGQTCSGSFENDPPNPQGDDYYFVDLEAGRTMTIDLTNIPAGANYDLVLYDARVLSNPFVSPVGVSNNPGQASERIILTNSAAGRYFIRVFMRTRSPSAPNAYDLRVVIS